MPLFLGTVTAKSTVQRMEESQTRSREVTKLERGPILGT